MLVIPLRVYLAAGLLIAACGATWWTTATHYRAKIKDIEMASVKAQLKGWQTAAQMNKESTDEWQKNLARVARKPSRPVVVYDDSMSSGGRGADAASGSGADQPIKRDIGPDLAACRDELYRLDALAKRVRNQEAGGESRYGQ